MNVTKDFIKALKTQKKQPTPYDTSATVTRIDGDTAWVHIAGGVDETPVRMTVNARKGDTVQVRVSGGRAFLVGNATAPPTDDTKAIAADTKATTAKVQATAAKEEATVAYDKAVLVESGLNGTLIYDHTYSITNGVATFVPHVYLKGEEVTSQFAASCFSWKYRLDSNVTGTPSYVDLITDSTTKGCTVNISTLGYGGHVIGTFTPPSA